MRLVVDSNVVFSALISKNYSANLIFSNELQLIAPEFIQIEFKRHQLEIQKKSGLSAKELSISGALIFGHIQVYPKEEYDHFKTRAQSISPDPNDWPFFALALKENCPIWSNDKKIKQQKQIIVYSTHELPISNKPKSGL